MWETICEASASCSGWNFGSKIPVYPKLGYGPELRPPPLKIEIWTGLGTLSFDYPSSPPPPEKLRFDRTWHFEFWLLQNTPHWDLDRTWHFEFWLPQFIPQPPKLRFGQNLALWVLTTQEYTPPQLRFDRTWHFEFWLPQNTPPNWDLDRTWHFEFLLPQNTPPPWKLKFGQNLTLWVLATPEYPPPPLRHGQDLALWVLRLPQNTPLPWKLKFDRT